MASSQVAYDDGVLRITRTGPGALAIAGEIDESTHDGLVSTLRKLADGRRTVQIDLAAVTYCDLAGMRAILLLGGPAQAGRAAGDGRLMLCGIPKQLRTVLHILGWDAAPGLTIAEHGVVGR
jgi:anti-anti-sigma regulatory factor